MDIDYSILTSQIDFVELGVALLSVAGLLAGVYVIHRGSQLIVSAIRPSDLKSISRAEYDEAARLSEESARRWE